MDTRHQKVAFRKAFGKGNYTVAEIAGKITIWATALATDVITPVKRVLDVCMPNRDAGTQAEIRRIVKRALHSEIDRQL